MKSTVIACCAPQSDDGGGGSSSSSSSPSSSPTSSDLSASYNTAWTIFCLTFPVRWVQQNECRYTQQQTEDCQQLQVSLGWPGHQTSELKLHRHTFIRFLAVCYQSVFVDQSRMGPAVLNDNCTDILPHNPDEIDSLFKVKIGLRVSIWILTEV